MPARGLVHRLVINARDPARAQIAADVVTHGGSPVPESSLSYAFRSPNYRDKVLAIIRGSYGTRCAEAAEAEAAGACRD